MKPPEPVPSVVLPSLIVGLWLVLQQTPRTVTVAPPSLVILPPLVAIVDVIVDNAVVVIEGKAAVVVVVTSFP